jgi:hypothetical protein
MSSRTGWTEVPEDKVTHGFEGDAVLVNDRIACVFRRGARGAEVYSLGPEKAALRATLAPATGTNTFTLASLIVVENSPALGIADAVFNAAGGRTLKLRYELKIGQPFVQTEARGGVTSLRVEAPSRFVVVAIVGLSVLAGFGAAFLLGRIRPRVRALAIAVMLAGVIADGWAVPIKTVAYEPRGRLEDRAIVEWLRAMPPGVVLHLPLMTAQFQELHYQYATLFHGHPLINGFTGWASPLQELLRQPRAPMYDYERYPATVTMLRSLGVRYVFVHPGDYNVTQEANGELRETVDGFRRSGQLAGEKRLLDVYAFELAPFASQTETTASLTPIPAAQFRVDVSQQKGRAEFLVDGDNDSRWIGAQDGSSVITAQFSEPRDVARIELQLAQRSLIEYPRDLQIDAEDREGHSRTLYHASPYAEFFAGFLRDRSYPAVRIDLPRNETMILRVRDVATYDSWWSVHELKLWRRGS